ncbi:hypothetical protein FRC19_001419 [Serendipita sp. 401]|nr:hypothetical protein FRC19_001419 [Serendipita sp. 401]
MSATCSVLGPAAAGKTTFINTAAQRGDLGVGHGIEAGTTEVVWIRPPHLIHDHNIIFMDTPGLDNPDKLDLEIVAMIKTSLQEAKIRLYAILYLHPISCNRMPGSELRRLKLLMNLWKADEVPNVIIVTTRWSEVEDKIGTKREEDLKNKFWAGLIASGCKVKRFYCTPQSALDILRPSPDKMISSSSRTLDAYIPTSRKTAPDKTAPKNARKKLSLLRLLLRQIFQRSFDDS